MKRILPAFLSCRGLRLDDDEKRLFERYNPLGVCLFSKYCANVRDKEQVSALVRDIKTAAGRDDVLIAVDQEGGRVRRLTEPEFTPVAAQCDIKDEETARLHARLISYDLKECGINVNFAPVLDIMTDKTSKVLDGRCFTDNHAKFGRAMTDEYIRCGVCPCIKHLPGHGRAAADPHLFLPVINESLEELQTDFAPFKALHDAPMGMAAHIVLTAVDPQNAVTVSAKAIKEIIRREIGFSGFLVSDAVVMRALGGSISERTKRALSAGCDAVCLGNAGFEENKELCESGAEISDEALERLKKIRKIISKQVDFTQKEQIKNKYCTNLKNIITYNSDYDATEVLNRLRGL